MMLGPLVGWLASTTCWGFGPGGCGTLVGLVGEWVGTLLGPEASGPHGLLFCLCSLLVVWVGGVGCVGLCFWLSLLCSAVPCVGVVGGWWGCCLRSA